MREEFKARCAEPVDIAKCREQLGLLIHGYFHGTGKAQIHIPTQPDDADVLISRALDELERLRAERGNGS